MADRIFSNPGNSVKQVFSRLLDDEGRPYFKVTSKHDLQAEIDSYRESCDINYIIARYMAGDPDALYRGNPVYGDFSEMPESYADLLNRIHLSEDAFNHLPLELRKKFDFSFEKFFASLDQPGTIEMISEYYNPTPAPDPGDPDSADPGDPGSAS